MTTKPETVPMRVTTLEAVAEALAGELCYCEICGDELALWPPDGIRAHIHEKHAASFWPQAKKLYDQFAALPESPERAALLQNERAGYLVKILAVRHDLYLKLVAAGAIVAPAQG